MGYRRDRNITKEVPHYRRMLIYLTPDRDAASLFTTQTFDLSKTLPWIDEYNENAVHKLTLLQLFVLAVGRAIAETPRTTSVALIKDGVCLNIAYSASYFGRSGKIRVLGSHLSLPMSLALQINKVPLLSFQQ